MKKHLLYLLMFWITPVFMITVSAQDRLKSLQISDVGYVSGIGWGFPTGETKDVLGPKYSGSLGLSVIMQDKKWFLYPSMDFLSFDYDQQVADQRYRHLVKNGKSNFYILNIAAGVRTKFPKWNFYGFIGPGLGLISEQRAEALNEETVRLKETLMLSPTLKGGGGIEYNIGNVALFIEVSGLHNFRKIQERSVNNVILFGGLKTNVTKLADKVVEVISDPTF